MRRLAAALALAAAVGLGSQAAASSGCPPQRTHHFHCDHGAEHQELLFLAARGVARYHVTSPRVGADFEARHLALEYRPEPEASWRSIPCPRHLCRRYDEYGRCIFLSAAPNHETTWQLAYPPKWLGRFLGLHEVRVRGFTTAGELVMLLSSAHRRAQRMQPIADSAPRKSKSRPGERTAFAVAGAGFEPATFGL
jgi:hypothetical protein